MSPQRYARIVLYLLGLGFFGLIVSCSAVPDRAGRETSPPALSALDSAPEAESALNEESKREPLPAGTVLGGPPPEAGEAPGAFRPAGTPEEVASLELASSPLEVPAPSGTGSLEETILSSPAMAPGDPQGGDPEGDIREVGTRLALDYGRYVGGFGDAEATIDSASTERIAAAARLVAWSFVGDSWSPDEPLLTDAVDTLAAADAPVEIRVLAAAGLERLGRTREAREVLRATYLEVPATPRTETDGAPLSGGFALSSVTFARNIDGPRDFEPTNPGVVPPGERVLIYGEFTNAAYEVRPSASSSGTPAYHRSFVAYLQLVTAAGEEVDRIDFLPPDLGQHVSEQPDEPVNFWVRYVVPRELRPGSYRIRIHATDLVTERYATEELELLVGRRAPLYGSGS